MPLGDVRVVVLCEVPKCPSTASATYLSARVLNDAELLKVISPIHQVLTITAELIQLGWAVIPSKDALLFYCDHHHENGTPTPTKLPSKGVTTS